MHARADTREGELWARGSLTRILRGGGGGERVHKGCGMCARAHIRAGAVVITPCAGGAPP
eukprot:4838580-Pleurochrysis_carterae.AAC.1